MAQPRSPWTQAILNHISDGRWYTIDEAIAVAMRVIPPGRAIQERERSRRKQRGSYSYAGTGSTKARTADQQIAIGARIIARDTVHTLRRGGHVERHGDCIRLTPTRDAA